MNPHIRYCIFAVCAIIGSVALGMHVNSNAYIVTAMCSVWLVYHLASWLCGDRGPTSTETFSAFYGSSKDDTDRSGDKTG